METGIMKGAFGLGSSGESKKAIASLQRIEEIIFRNFVTEIPEGMTLYAISGKRALTEIEKTEIEIRYITLKRYFSQLQESGLILTWRKEKSLMRIKMALLAAESVTGKIPLVE